VTDIFFSYSSIDRERVRPVRYALTTQGFEVFWDQETRPGSTRGQLDSSAPCEIPISFRTQISTQAYVISSQSGNV
jgi:hypothetical protein